MAADAQGLINDMLAKARSARVLVKNPESMTTLVSVSDALARVLKLERETAKQNETKFEQMKANVRKL